MTTEDLVAETNKEGSIYMLRGDPGFKFVNVEDEDGEDFETFLKSNFNEIFSPKSEKTPPKR